MHVNNKSWNFLSFVMGVIIIYGFIINITFMSKGFGARECENFQNSLTYEKIDAVWKHFREAGNSL